MASGVKRSLFSKPSWAAPSASTKPDAASENESIFGRNLAYHDIVRAQKAERQRKAAKVKAQKNEGPEAKRRRISEEQDEWDSDDLKKEKEKPMTRSTPKKEKALRDGLEESPKAHKSPRRRNGKATMINLEADDDELIMLTPPEPKKKAKAKDDLDDDSEEEDEYLRELKAKAREKARLPREQGSLLDRRPSTPFSRHGSTPHEPDNTRSSSMPQEPSRPTSSTSTYTPATSKSPQIISPPPVAQDDPLLKILIQSTIPGTNSLIVKRKASQSLKQVKEFWCKKFNLPEELAGQVFFTWKGTRLFDSTTMRGIVRGLKRDAWEKERASVDREENDEWGADREQDDFDERIAKDPSDGHILLEAMTPEIHDRRVREREKQRQQENNTTTAESSDVDNTEIQTPTSSSVEEKDSSIIIRLVAKNLEPMQLRVRPHTTVAKIMRGFAATRGIEEGKTAWLIFEGERLDPDSTVEEVGFEDEGMVEVSVR